MDSELTPPKGNRAEDVLPMRRLSDKIACPHPAPSLGIFDGHVLLHYLVSSASIAVLVLVWHVWRTIKHIDVAVNDGVLRIVEQNIEQTKELKNIHESIHAEARTIQAGKK